MFKKLITLGIVLSIYAPGVFAQEQLPSQDAWAQEPYIIEENNVSIRLRTDYSAEENRRARIKIQKEEAKSWGEIPLQYDAESQEIKDIDAFVETPDGRTLKYKEVYDTPVYQEVSIYSNLRAKMIILPEVNIGSIVEYSYTLVTKPLIEEGYWTRFLDYFDAPEKHDMLKLIVPKNIELQISYYNGFPEPKIETGADEKTYSWDRHDLDKTRVEDSMPAYTDVLPWCGITTLPSWKIIDSWYSKKFADKMFADTQIRDEVRALVKDEKDPAKQIDIIAAYLQKNLRYISLAGFYTFGPHLATEVFKNKYGDCEDQTCLLITMLKECGIKAMPALYRAAVDGKIYEELPMLNFNHVIAAIEIEGKMHFVDPLVGGFRFGETPPSMEGASVFIADGKGGFITTLPVLDEAAQLNSFVVKMKLLSNGSATKTEEDVYDREDSIAGKKAYQSYGDQEKKAYLEKHEATMTSGGNLISFDWGDIDNLYTPLTIKAVSDIPEWATVQGEYMIFQPWVSPRSDWFTAKERLFPVRTYTGNVDAYKTVYEIPEEFQIICIPDDFSLETVLTKIESTFKVVEGTIIHQYAFWNKRGLMSVAEYPQLKSYYDKVSQASRKFVILKKKTIAENKTD